MKRDQILDAAKVVVTRQRNNQYGEPEDNFLRIAILWNAYMSAKYGAECLFTPVDVAEMLSLLKKARKMGTPYNEDNYIDDAGYSALGGELAGRAAKEELEYTIRNIQPAYKEHDDEDS